VVFLRAEVPPSTVGVDPRESAWGRGRGHTEHVLTAHYLVLGASTAEVVGLDGRPRPSPGLARHESGLALLTVEGAGYEPARLAEDDEVRVGDPVFLLTCTGDRERRGANGTSPSWDVRGVLEYMLDGRSCRPS